MDKITSRLVRVLTKGSYAAWLGKGVGEKVRLFQMYEGNGRKVTYFFMKHFFNIIPKAVTVREIHRYMHMCVHTHTALTLTHTAFTHTKRGTERSSC